MTAARYFLPKGTGLVDLIIAMLNSELRYCRRSKDSDLSTRGLVIAKKDLKRWAVGDTALSVSELARRLKINQQSAYDLVRQGYIETRNLGRLGRVIEPMGLSRFQSRYALARDLVGASQFGSVRSMVAGLKKLNILPISGPGRDGCRQYLYLRRDIESINWGEF